MNTNRQLREAISRLKKIILLVAVSAFVLTGCDAVKYETTPMPTPTPPLQPRAIERNSLAFAEQWRYRTSLSNSYRSVPGNIFLNGNKVIMGFFREESESDFDSFLIDLSMENGEIIWQIHYKDPGYGTYIGDALLDEKAHRLYLEYSFRISGFDLETGKQLWLTPDLGGHTEYRFTPGATDPLMVRSSQEEMIRIDPETGKVLSREPMTEPFWTIHHGGLAISNEDYTLSAMDASSGQVLWWLPGLDAEFWPTFIGADMIVQYYSPLICIYRLNVRTGIGVWGTMREYVSNYAISGQRLYALHKDGRLVAFNVDTGDILGEIEFDLEPTMLGSRPFFVAAERPYVLVYFGDNQELIVFKEQ